MSSILIPTDATCLTCRWFALERSEDDTGTCRRHCPPWFDVADTDFCGDWTSDYFPVPHRRRDD